MRVGIPINAAPLPFGPSSPTRNLITHHQDRQQADADELTTAHSFQVAIAEEP